MAFGLCPLLNQGAVEAIEAHASEELKAEYLPKMIRKRRLARNDLTERVSRKRYETAKR